MTLSIDVGTKNVAHIALTVVLGLIGDRAMAQTVQGTATYRERMALPPGAVFEATIEDVSRADAPSSVIASTRVASPGNPPIAFSIAYDKAKILPDHRYVVRAKILLNDKLLFTSDSATPVITGGSPTSVSMMLRRAGAGPTAPGKPASPASSGPPSNRPLEATYWGRGTWKASGSSQLELGPLALTRAKCPDGSLHDHLVKQWSYIRSYVVKNGHLYLALMADGGTYEFEPLVRAKP